MSRDRPLTWLFVIATICVDAVMAATDKSQGISVLRIGFILGQLAALSIWTVRGQSHRLMRVSGLVVITGTMAYLIEASSEPIDVWVAAYSGYVFFIVMATFLGNFLWRVFEYEKSKSSVKRWQIPLIEFFGWTTVVAIISFGGRHMDFTFLLQNNGLLIFFAMLAVPVSTALLIRQDLRDLRSVRAIILVIVASIAAAYMDREAESGAFAIFVQTTYLTLWLAVLAMDEVKTNAKSMHESLQEEIPQVTEPKLFNPQD